MKKLIAVCLLLMLSISPVAAQTLTGDVAVGGGGMFGEEDVTFNRESLFFAAHWSGVELPLSAGSGLGVEVRFPGIEGQEVAYTLWSLNRIDVSDSLYTGTDMQIYKGSSADFDTRIVIGFNVAIERIDANLSIELYTLEDDRPIAFVILYKF